MDPKERLRRPEPERTGPNREMKGIYRQPDPDPWAHDGADGRRSFDQRPYRSGEGPPSDGVDTAYQVIQEWFRQGQRSAQFNSRRWNDPRFDPRGAGAPINETVQRLMRSYTDMAPTFADFVTSMATLWCSQMYPYHTYAHYAPYPPRDPYSAYPSKAPEPDYGAKISVEIHPPNRGHYNLQIHPVPASIKVQPLQPPDPDPAKPPLTVAQNTVNQRITLTVDIPTTQAAGDYIGSVLDAHNNHPVGNLTVTIKAAPPAPPPPPSPPPRPKEAKG